MRGQTTDVDDCRREAVDWLVRLAPGHATVDDLAAFEQWRGRSRAHAAAFVEVRRLWDELGPAGRNVQGTTGSALRAYAAAPAPQIGRRMFLGGALAASVAVAGYVAVRPPLELWPSLAELNADYRTEKGEQRQVVLTDNVSVAMNTQTSIAVRAASGEADRIELITGEGTMTARSRPLEVVAGLGRTSARNAKFNMRRDGDAVVVTCLDGEVLIDYPHASVPLGPQRQLSYSDQRLGSAVAVDPLTVTAWQAGYLIFHDTPLAEVVTEINRYRHGRIILASSELGRRPVNGRFYLDRIDDAVTKIQSAFGARTTSLPGGVVILS